MLTIVRRTMPLAGATAARAPNARRTFTRAGGTVTKETAAWT